MTPMAGHDVCAGDSSCECPTCREERRREAGTVSKYDLLVDQGRWRRGCGESWSTAVAQCVCGAWRPEPSVAFPHVAYQHSVSVGFQYSGEFHVHWCEVKPGTIAEAVAKLDEAGARMVEVEADHEGGTATIRWYGPTPSLEPAGFGRSTNDATRDDTGAGAA